MNFPEDLFNYRVASRSTTLSAAVGVFVALCLVLVVLL